MIFGLQDADELRRYMAEVLKINSIGYIVFIIFLIFSELSKGKTKLVRKITIAIRANVSSHGINIAFVFFVLCWHIICLRYCHGYPLTTGNRSFYLNTGISFVYLFLNECIVLMTLIYTIDFALYRKQLIRSILGIITVALQGNRSALIIYTILPVILIKVYWNKGNKQTRASIRKKINKLLFTVFILGCLGIIILLFRKKVSISPETIMKEVFLGNSFSDIRDGAIVLRGFLTVGKCKFVNGKTFFAGIISFIPSSISEFRYKWSWGRYVTLELLNMKNHFGLRGGNSLEAYINFGWVGVFVFSCLHGIMSGYLEKVYYYYFIVKKYDFQVWDYFVFSCFIWIRNFFISGTNTYNLYVDIIMIIFVVVISRIMCISGRRRRYELNI